MKQKVKEDLKNALLQGDALKTGTLRMLLAALLNKEKEKRYTLSKENPDFQEEELIKNSELSDEEFLQAVSSEAKKRKEAFEAFEKGGRRESAEKEKKEMEILQAYLPEQLSEEEIRRLAKETIEKIGARPKDAGQVMKELMPKLRGKADGALVSAIVKKMLG